MIEVVTAGRQEHGSSGKAGDLLSIICQNPWNGGNLKGMSVLRLPNAYTRAKGLLSSRLKYWSERTQVQVQHPGLQGTRSLRGITPFNISTFFLNRKVPVNGKRASNKKTHRLEANLHAFFSLPLCIPGTFTKRSHWFSASRTRSSLRTSRRANMRYKLFQSLTMLPILAKRG